GSPLLLLHGGGLTSTGEGSFFPQLEGLSDSLRVIAPDQIGFGWTDPAKDGKFKNRLERCNHVVAFMKAIGIDNAYVGGHSEGGFVATRIAIDHPGLVSRLIIFSSGSAAPMLGGVRDDAWLEAANRAYNHPEPHWTEDQMVESARRGCYVFDARM